ncbi:GNAT family N-acetyltransferase [Altererythrobacter salegens]|uniref:GNAT family N-acetyltransferase n=1 Tax=Croceibacterium salegens TaxID=1737568 RepID=A0A6I4SX51_9SPHN|nr:GNAT family N-acetyltransferase [Croceibacterium salegens]MXO60433.1 GNAT family N-acetyltransferase [Croceibacterium salegens]
MEFSAIHAPVLDLRTAEGATAHQRAWRHLDTRATLPTQHPDFLSALRETLLAGDELALFQVETQGRFDAVLPLARSPGAFARWRLAGDNEVFEPGDAAVRDSVAAHRLATLVARERRPLVMARVPASSAFVPALREAMAGRGLVDVRPAPPCPTIALDESWSEPESRFNARRRSDFRRAARRAAEFGQVSFETLTPSPDEFDAHFDAAIAVEAASWKREAGTAIACDPRKEAFFRAYLKAACEDRSCRIAFLRLSGEIAAMHLAVELGGRHWLYKIGFDERFQRCSPGTLLMLHVLGDAARRRIERFELMGDAESWIAELWTREEHSCVQLRTYPFGMAGAVAFAADSARWARQRLVRVRR